MSVNLHSDGASQESPNTSEGAGAPEIVTQPAANDTPPAAEGNTPPAEGSPTGEPAAAPTPFSPNLKFKVMDKEHEIDAFLKDAIKDADSEKKVKELYEKAYGLDVVKPRLTETRKELGEIKTQHNELLGQINDLRQDYARGDLDSFFKKLQVPEEKVLQWCLDKVQYQQLPQDQRQVLDARKSAEQRAWDAEKRAEMLEQQMHERVSQAQGTVLQVALERPDVKTFAEAFDAKLGKPGSFRDAVCDLGEYAHMKSGGKSELTPDQAISQIMQHYGSFVQPVAATPAPAAQPAPQAQGQPQVPVIPNVGGRAASPTKPKVKTLEDIKKLAASM